MMRNWIGGLILGLALTTLVVAGETSVDQAGETSQPTEFNGITLRLLPNGAELLAETRDTERTFLTFEQARDTVRELRKTDPQRGVRVILGAGTYAIDTPWFFTAEDSGTPESPIEWIAEPGAILSGGVVLDRWVQVMDPDILQRVMTESTATKIWQIDLKAVGVTDFGDATTLGKRPELFADGVPQTLARYPNDGFLELGEVLGTTKLTSWAGDGAKEGYFRYNDSRMDRWATEADARLFGYFFWDWADDYGKIAKLDTQAKTISMATPYHSYGYKPGQRFYGVNLFCELDSPGEWYLDREQGVLYWIPPTGLDPTQAQVTLSCFAGDAMVQFNGVSDVRFTGFTLTEGRGDAIQVYDSYRVSITNCDVTRFGGNGLQILRCECCGVANTVFRSLGMGGITLSGGDRKTLTPGLNYVLRTTVEDFGRLKRTYAPAVLVEGCGNRIAENLFRKSSSSAIRIEGNDHLIERNRFVEVVQESDDQGGIDIWYNPGYRGIVIRDNYFCDIVGGTHCGAAAIRLDDMISGVAITGNVIERCGSVQFGGVQIHGGKENLVEGNLFIDCFAVASFSRWGQQRWLEALDRPDMKEKLYQTVDIDSPIWQKRYPELAKIRENADVNTLRQNWIYGGCMDGLWLRDGGIQHLENNVVLTTDELPGVTATELPGASGVLSKLEAITQLQKLKTFTEILSAKGAAK